MNHKSVIIWDRFLTNQHGFNLLPQNSLVTAAVYIVKQEELWHQQILLTWSVLICTSSFYYSGLLKFKTNIAAAFVADVGTTLSFNKHHVNCFKIIRFCLSFLEKNYLGHRNLAYPCQLLVTRLDLNTAERQLIGLLFDGGSFVWVYAFPQCIHWVLHLYIC